MGFIDHVECSSLIAGDNYVLYKVAIVFAVTRWVFSWALRLFRDSSSLSALRFGLSLSSSDPPFSSTSSQLQLGKSSSSRIMLEDKLRLTSFKEVAERLPESRGMTCAVCLNRLRNRDPVRELSNCCHVFHSHCLDRWLDYDFHMTCPLCRAPLIENSIPPSTRSVQQQQEQQPSWAVERLLYLFGDDPLS